MVRDDVAERVGLRTTEQKAHKVCERLGLKLVGRERWKELYCTTNLVVANREIVLKEYKKSQGFAVESRILKARALFTFRMPEIIGLLEDPTLGYWIALKRIPGRTLADAIPAASSQIRSLVDRIVVALAEFERTASSIEGIPWQRWTWVESVAPLAAWCSRYGAASAAEIFKDAAIVADERMNVGDGVPCFDLYFRNIIWSSTGSFMELAFVDFDKANRLVPYGEQLSHLAMSPRCAALMDHARETYARLLRLNILDLKRLVDVAVFFRALSGIRDSLPWNLLRRGRQDRHPALREQVFAFSISKAGEAVATGSVADVLGSHRQARLAGALSEVAEIVGRT